jgi:hypothetical protein
MGSHRKLHRSAQLLPDEEHDCWPIAECLIKVAMKRPPGPGRSDIPDPQIKLRCQAVIASLAAPRPFSLDAFRISLEGQRHRPLVLTAATMPPAYTGLWVSTERADYIFYEQDAAADEQLRIILHEIGHMVLNHLGIPFTGRVTARLFPHLDPDMVAAALAGSVSSSVYSETEELEADTFTTVFLETVRDSR